MSRTSSRAVPRRQVLAGAGAVAAAAVALPACAEYGSGGQAQPPASSPAPQTGGGGAGTDTGGGPEPLASATDIPVGGGTVFADRKVVVTQPQAGTFAAFDTTCPHQGCNVNEVVGGTMNCPCHGSRFRIADGSVDTGPAARGLTARQVQVADGSITVT